MFNLGGPEILVILLLALIVLGPDKLPEAAKSVGRFTSEVRRMSNGFRSEMKAAFDAETSQVDSQADMQGGGPEDDAAEAQARARGELVARGTEAPIEPTEPVEPAAPIDEP